MVQEGYVVIDYKNVDGVYIIDEITKRDVQCIQGINPLDLPS
jgi:hypothetical protein